LAPVQQTAGPVPNCPENVSDYPLMHGIELTSVFAAFKHSNLYEAD